MMNFKGYLLLISINFLTITCGEEVDIKGTKISLSVPQLSEEENDSNHMPHHLKCDACLAVAHQLKDVLIKEHSKKSKIYESDVIDILENLCNNGFGEYGIKQVDGINRLSGPGLEGEKVMGMAQMGGRWPHRLQEMCHYYVGEAGEMDIYNVFTEGENNLAEFLCHGKGIYSHCSLTKQSKTEL